MEERRRRKRTRGWGKDTRTEWKKKHFRRQETRNRKQGRIKLWRKVLFEFEWSNRVKRWGVEWNKSERWTVYSLASCFHRQTTCSCGVQAWGPEDSSWPLLALCSLGACSHPSRRLRWGLHLAPPATLQAPVQGLGLLCPDRGHLGTDLTGKEERRIIRTILGLN